MKVALRAVTVCCAGLICLTASGLFATVEADTQVVAKDLNAARVPGKVAAVIWTVRSDHCTLQVVFPNGGRIDEAMRDDPKLKRQRPSVQV